MQRPYRLVVAVCASIVLASFAGCGGGNPAGAVKVTGTIKYSDGTIPNVNPDEGNTGTVTFQPDTKSQRGKAATGDIQPDGSFTLLTVEPGDGAIPGDYKVTVSIINGYPDGKWVVADDFREPDTTPLKATVKPSGDNHFDFVIEKP